MTLVRFARTVYHLPLPQTRMQCVCALSYAVKGPAIEVYLGAIPVTPVSPCLSSRGQDKPGNCNDGSYIQAMTVHGVFSAQIFDFGSEVCPVLDDDGSMLWKMTCAGMGIQHDDMSQTLHATESFD